jgi:hypothetical protein
MIELLGLLLATLGSVFRSRKRLILENLLLRQQLQVALRCQRRPRVRTRDKLFWLLVRHLFRKLAKPSPPCPARDYAALASPGLAPVLALAVASSAQSAAIDGRGPISDRHHGAREPPLGHRADPRRAAQAWHRRQRPLHPPVPTSWASSAAQPELAHLPRQPCPGHLGS